MIEGKIERNSWFILVFLSIIWGCSFILIKKSLIAFTPVQLACLRITISSLAFTPVVWYHRKDIDWSFFFKFFLVGLTGSGIPAFLFFIAQTQVSSSVAGLLNSLTPIWTLVIGIFIFKTGFTKNRILGVALGFAGAVSLLLLGGEKYIGGNPYYGILIVLATICYGTSVNIVQTFFSKTKPIVISAVSFFTIGPIGLIYLLSTDFIELLTTNKDAGYALGAVTLLSLFGTVMASILFYHLVQKTNAVFASSVTFLMPIVALAWGVVDKEIIGIPHIIAMVMILSGVYLIKKR